MATELTKKEWYAGETPESARTKRHMRIARTFLLAIVAALLVVIYL